MSVATPPAPASAALPPVDVAVTPSHASRATAPRSAHCLQDVTNVRTSVVDGKHSSPPGSSASPKRASGVLPVPVSQTAHTLSSSSASHEHGTPRTGKIGGGDLALLPASAIMPIASGDSMPAKAPAASGAMPAAAAESNNAFLEQSRMVLMRLSQLNLSQNSGFGGALDDLAALKLQAEALLSLPLPSEVSPSQATAAAPMVVAPAAPMVAPAAPPLSDHSPSTPTTPTRAFDGASAVSPSPLQSVRVPTTTLHASPMASQLSPTNHSRVPLASSDHSPSTPIVPQTSSRSQGGVTAPPTLPLTEENLAQHTHAAVAASASAPSPFRVLPHTSPAFHTMSTHPSSVVRPTASVSQAPSRSKSAESKAEKNPSSSTSSASPLKKSDSSNSRKGAYGSPRKKKPERRTSISSHAASRQNRSKTPISVAHPHPLSHRSNENTTKPNSLPRGSASVSADPGSSQPPPSNSSRRQSTSTPAAVSTTGAKRKNSAMSDISTLSTSASSMSMSVSDGANTTSATAAAASSTAPQTPVVPSSSSSSSSSALVSSRHMRTTSIGSSTYGVITTPLYDRHSDGAFDARDLQAQLDQERMRRQIAEETVRSLQLRRMVIGLGDLPSGASPSPGRSPSFDSLFMERRASVGGASFGSSSVRMCTCGGSVVSMTPSECSDASTAHGNGVLVGGGGAGGGKQPDRIQLALLCADPLVIASEGGTYRSLDRLDFKQEEDLIFDGLRETGKLVRVRKYSGTTEPLRLLLLSSCTMLHFSGHGMADSNGQDVLLFEDAAGCAHLVSESKLARLLGGDEDSIGATSAAAGGGGAVVPATSTGSIGAGVLPGARHHHRHHHHRHQRPIALRLVFVASCHSRRVGEVFLRAGVEHVVCVRRDERVMDKASMTFARSFYHALFTGRRNVRAAFHNAQVRVSAEAGIPETECDKFVLLSDPTAPPSPILPREIQHMHSPTSAAATASPHSSCIHPQNVASHLQTPSRPVTGGIPAAGVHSSTFSSQSSIAGSSRHTSPRSPAVTRKHVRTSTLTGLVCSPVSPPASATACSPPLPTTVGRTPEKRHRRQRSDPSPLPFGAADSNGLSSFAASPKRPRPPIQMTSVLPETPSNIATRNHALSHSHSQPPIHSHSQPPVPMVHRTSSVGSLSGFNVFAYLPDGGVVDTTPVPRYHSLPSRQNFIGRNKDIHQVNKLLSKNHLVTIRGPPGIGKTSMCQAVSHYLVKRTTFEDGVLFVSVRGCKTAAAVFMSMSLAIKKDEPYLVPPALSMNSRQSTAHTSPSAGTSGATSSSAPSCAKQASSSSSGGTGADRSGCISSGPSPKGPNVSSRAKKEKENAINHRKFVMSVLQRRHVLVVLDNVEDPLHSCPGDFRMMLQDILNACNDVSVLIGSRQPVGGGVLHHPEKVYTLNPLGRLDAARLFKLCSPRPITLDELGIGMSQANSATSGELLEILASHPVLTILGGHPQAITLACPLLLDRTLNEVRQMLQTKTLDSLQVEGIPDEERSSVNTLHSSLSVSVDHLHKIKPESVKFFSIMALLPAGARVQDFDGVWGPGWRKLASLLCKCSLIVRRPIQIQSRVVDCFRTFPFVTDYAARLLIRDPKFCKETVSKFRAYFAKIGEEMFQVMGDGSINAVRAYEQLEFVELNFWACLRTWGVSRKTKNHNGGQHDDKSTIYSPPQTSNDGSLPTRSKPSPVARLAIVFSGILLLAGRHADSFKVAERGMSLIDGINDVLGEANLRKVLGVLFTHSKETAHAKKNLGRALVLYKSLNSSLGEAVCLTALGYLNAKAGHTQDACNFYERALPLYERLGHRAGMLNSFKWLHFLFSKLPNSQHKALKYEDLIKKRRYHSIHSIRSRPDKATQMHRWVGEDVSLHLQVPTDDQDDFGLASSSQASVGSFWRRQAYDRSRRLQASSAKGKSGSLPKTLMPRKDMPSKFMMVHEYKDTSATKDGEVSPETMDSAAIQNASPSSPDAVERGVKSVAADPSGEKYAHSPSGRRSVSLHLPPGHASAAASAKHSSSSSSSSTSSPSGTSHASTSSRSHSLHTGARSRGRSIPAGACASRAPRTPKNSVAATEVHSTRSMTSASCRSLSACVRSAGGNSSGGSHSVGTSRTSRPKSLLKSAASVMSDQRSKSASRGGAQPVSRVKSKSEKKSTTASDKSSGKSSDSVAEASPGVSTRGLETVCESRCSHDGNPSDVSGGDQKLANDGSSPTACNPSAASHTSPTPASCSSTAASAASCVSSAKSSQTAKVSSVSEEFLLSSRSSKKCVELNSASLDLSKKRVYPSSISPRLSKKRSSSTTSRGTPSVSAAYSSSTWPANSRSPLAKPRGVGKPKHERRRPKSDPSTPRDSRSASSPSARRSSSGTNFMQNRKAACGGGCTSALCEKSGNGGCIHSPVGTEISGGCASPPCESETASTSNTTPVASSVQRKGGGGKHNAGGGKKRKQNRRRKKRR